MNPINRFQDKNIQNFFKNNKIFSLIPCGCVIGLLCLPLLKNLFNATLQSKTDHVEASDDNNCLLLGEASDSEKISIRLAKACTEKAANVEGTDQDENAFFQRMYTELAKQLVE